MGGPPIRKHLGLRVLRGSIGVLSFLVLKILEATLRRPFGICLLLL